MLKLENYETLGLPEPLLEQQGRLRRFRVKCEGAEGKFRIFESANEAAKLLSASATSILIHARKQGLTTFRGYRWYLLD